MDLALTSWNLCTQPENQDNFSQGDGWMSSAPTQSRAMDVLDPK